MAPRGKWTTRRAFCAALLALGSASAFGQVCQPSWSKDFAVGEPHGTAGESIRCFEVHDDDGAGPRRPGLYVGGAFEFVGGVRRNSIARWDGEQWESLGDGVRVTTPFSSFGEVLSMTTWDEDGPGPLPESLVIGGKFLIVGGVETANVARWRSGQWIAMDAVVSNEDINALAAYDEDGAGPEPAHLFAGGEFSVLNGFRGLARWTGNGWECLGGSPEPVCSFGSIQRLLLNDEDGAGPLPVSMYAAGGVVTLGGQFFHGVVRWDGVGVHPLSDITHGAISGLATVDWDGPGGAPARVYAGGEFFQVGGVPFNQIAEWNGANWNPLGLGTSGGIETMAEYDPDGAGPTSPELVVAGRMAEAGGAPARRIARWNGTAWSPMGTGVAPVGLGTDSPVHAMRAYDADGAGPLPNLLYVGGDFVEAGGVSVNSLATWDGTRWSAVGNGLTGEPNASGVTGLAVCPIETGQLGGLERGLYVAGRFPTAGRFPAANIARWSGTSWATLGSGTNDSVRALTQFDDDGAGPQLPVLYAGGSFTLAGEVPVSRIARWDGTAWTALPDSGVDGIVYSLHVSDAIEAHSLYVGGAFTHAGSQTINRVARWSGSAWSPVGTGTSGDVRTLIDYDPDGAGPLPTALLVGGLFQTAGGVTVKNVATWDGTTWTGLGGGTNGLVRSSAVFDPPGPPAPQLYICGLFTQASGVNAPCIARLQGGQWVALGGNTLDEVDSVTVFDPDGNGPLPAELFVGGNFNNVANHIAKWNGSAWSAVGLGTDSRVYSMCAFRDNPGAPAALFMTGTFMTGGGYAAGRITRWGCDVPPCYPDCNTDGALTLSDFGCFQTKFALGDPYADCNGDAMFNLSDFGCFQTKFALGCP